MTVETSNDGDASQLSKLSSPLASTRRMLVFASSALLAGIVVVWGLCQIGSERHAGYLHSATETISAGRQARITKLLVKPGDAVKPGTPLLILKDASLENARGRKQDELSALEAELRQAQAKASVEIADRKAKLEADIFEAQLKQASFEEKRFDQRLSLFAAENRVMIAQAEARLSDDQLVYAGKETDLPFEPLTISQVQRKTVPKRDFLRELQEREATRNKLEASEAQVGLCEERLNLLKKQLDGVAAQINEAFGVNVIQTRISAAQASLAQLDAEAPTLTVTARKHGTVGVFAKGLGETVGPAEEIVEIFDADQPYIMAEIPTRLLAKFPAKAEVELVFPGGKVRKGQVSELPPQAARLPGPRDSFTESSGQIRLRILPSGQIWPAVPFGTHVEVCKPIPQQAAEAKSLPVGD